MFPNKVQRLGSNGYHGIIFVMITLICITLCCCETRHNAVYELIEFREEIKNHGNEYSQADWENAMDEYAVISQELDMMKLTDEELKEVAKIKGEIAGITANSIAKQIIQESEKLANEFAGFLEGVEEGLNINNEISNDDR